MTLSTIIDAIGVEPYFRDDDVVIYHADCRDILPKMPQVDLVLADPPYGVGIAEWDTFIAPKEWLQLYSAPITLVFPSIGRMFDYPTPDWVLSWVRDNSTQRNGTGGFNHWEPILLYGKARFSKDSVRAIDHGNHDFHPSVKPLYLISWLIEQSSAQAILDPFMGSGTTLRAAKDLGRFAIGIEIEEQYCEIAAKRMSQMVMAL
jgi:site-specific DNA-methyltransferase (adenine-specific)